MKTRHIAWYACGLVLVCAFNVKADADGAFCVGSGYAAIDTRGLWLSAEVPGIRVVRQNAIGALELLEAEVPGNVNRQVRCEPEKVLVSNGYRVEIAASLQVLPDAGAENADYSADLLPYVYAPAVLDIPSDHNKSRLYLVISYLSKGVPAGGVLHFISARVVRTSVTGDFVESKLLGEVVRLETVH